MQVTSRRKGMLSHDVQGPLRSEGIQPEDVWLGCHKDPKAPKGNPNPYHLWKQELKQLELYQRNQEKEVVSIGELIASFVVERGTEPATFAGL